MKKKRVKYLAITQGREELLSLEDKVKEFKLYDIQVINYGDLSISVFDFINKTY
jgi:hypothetical protein